MKTAAIILGVIVVIAGLGLLYVYSGSYNIAASGMHFGITKWMLSTMMERSVRRKAKHIQAPPLDNPAMVSVGFHHYDQMCLTCHGAPGVSRSEIGKGLNPEPPALAPVVEEWTPAELFWITKHGIKMTGMPAFGETHPDEELWGIIAFLLKLPDMTSEQYLAMRDSSDMEMPDHRHDDGHAHMEDTTTMKMEHEDRHEHAPAQQADTTGMKGEHGDQHEHAQAQQADTMGMKMEHEDQHTPGHTQQADSTEMKMEQHDHAQHESVDTTMKKMEHEDRQDHGQHQMADTAEMKMEHDMPMTHSYSLSLPMNRNGSGTGWLPDASPMYGYMSHHAAWMFMFHGNLFIRYNHQDVTEEGTRGDSKVDAPNFIMAMGQRQVGTNGLFHFNIMLSADPVTVGESGYPLLFQTGETFEGKPLVDRQHPHDLFDELSVTYTQRLSEALDVTGYFGLPGEPALGPVAFMHRVSAMPNPDAPLGHHWQDATHITFGVATLGLRYNQFKLEGSQFTGREPDENRYDIDEPKFDSQSLRLNWNPGARWAMQVSHAFINSPESLDPGEDVHRSTVSLIHAMPLNRSKSFWNSTAAWGYNYVNSDHKENSLLLESALDLTRWIIFGRIEGVEKSAEELALTGLFDVDEQFFISALTLGTNYRFYSIADTDFLVGGHGSLYFPDRALQPIYGDNPLALELYVRLSPAHMIH